MKVITPGRPRTAFWPYNRPIVCGRCGQAVQLEPDKDSRLIQTEVIRDQRGDEDTMTFVRFTCTNCATLVTDYPKPGDPRTGYENVNR